MENSKGAREKAVTNLTAKRRKTIQFETCSGSCARANGKISLDKAIKTIQKGLTGGVPLSNR